MRISCYVNVVIIHNHDNEIESGNPDVQGIRHVKTGFLSILFTAIRGSFCNLFRSQQTENSRWYSLDQAISYGS
ncbi:MAG: hypothetical protein A2W28_10500 [Gammaproteobacteria bacterium RBG_16_51_14]|nr:MAG: hypothetical protein A2W28_10500 [Gammaproteobacteria bacterium RBG_16_51_14]